MNNSFPHSGLRILIADDDADDRDMLREAIEGMKADATLDTVHNGVELMKYLSEYPENAPHILFLDLNLQRKNGIECLIQIRNNPALEDIMVAMYSTSKEQIDIETAFDAGANLFIPKPTDFTVVEKIVRQVLLIDWQFHTSHFYRESFVMAA